MFIEQQICILERFLKDHVTMKGFAITGIWKLQKFKIY